MRRAGVVRARRRRAALQLRDVRVAPVQHHAHVARYTMMLPMCNQCDRVPARRARLHIDAVHLDVCASLVGYPQRGVPLVERVVAGEVQRVPRVGERHPRRELAVEAD